MFELSPWSMPHRHRRLDPLRGLAFVGLLGVPMLALAHEYRIDHQTGMRYGAPVAVASGTARAYLSVRDGAPTELGVAVSESALAGAWDGHGPETHDLIGVAGPEYSLPLPKRNPTPFRSVSLRWDPPDGLESAGVAGRAHLHLRFYIVRAAERRRIDRRDSRGDPRGAPNRSPELVSRQRAAPEALAVLDVHCGDPAGSEFDRGRPAGTVLSGSRNGELASLECVATAPFLPRRASVFAEIPRASLQTPPYHGTRQRIVHDADRREYHIVLSDFAVDD